MYSYLFSDEMDKSENLKLQSDFTLLNPVWRMQTRPHFDANFDTCGNEVRNCVSVNVKMDSYPGLISFKRQQFNEKLPLPEAATYDELMEKIVTNVEPQYIQCKAAINLRTYSGVMHLNEIMRNLYKLNKTMFQSSSVKKMSNFPRRSSSSKQHVLVNFVSF